jgi:hypothetical protein
MKNQKEELRTNPQSMKKQKEELRTNPQSKETLHLIKI